jgi:23S rRNA (cytosine1962-C5)-methyltransferase
VENPLFVLISNYATGLGATVMENILRLNLKSFNGDFFSYELGLPTNEGILLPCGTSAMFVGKKN